MIQHTNSELGEMVRRLRVGNRTSHPALDGLRWVSESTPLRLNGQVCRGYVVFGSHPKKSRRDQSWLGVVTQGPDHNPDQRFWVVYSGENPVLAASEVSQRLYTRTLKGFVPEAGDNLYNLLPGDQVERDLLEQIHPRQIPSALGRVLGVNAS